MSGTELTQSTSATRKGRPDPFTLVIFGATGDLTHRKLVPAVYSLFQEAMLPDRFAVVGFARREKTDEVFREEVRAAISPAQTGVDGQTWTRFANRLYYHRSTFEDLAGFHSLRRRLADLDKAEGMPGNYLFYLATQPDFFGPIVDRLREAGLIRPETTRPWSRAIVEKPFGRDLMTARELNDRITAAFSEKQIFRIDHYLGKETVQNILVFRFANSIFEPLWNQEYVDHVQISVGETLGVEGRGKYYEKAGALRDIVQNHMMHLLCLVAMESPSALDAASVRDEKVKVLKALRPISSDCAIDYVVRGQYTAGTSHGKQVPGYSDEENVAADSTTETYAALKVYVDNRRWAGVPFYLRTGKRMPARITEISIHFKRVPRVLFNIRPSAQIPRNVLALRIQPNEGISLRFQVKTPGVASTVRPFQMDFGYAAAFGKEPPEAYQRLLLDAALGDPTLFIRRDEVEAAWSFITPVLEGCAAQGHDGIAAYSAGTWGPKEADDLLTADGRRWMILRRPTPPLSVTACSVSGID